MKSHAGLANSARCARLLVAVLPVVILVTAPAVAPGLSNIDPLGAGNQYGWGANIGWIDLEGYTTQGVVVRPSYLEGFAYAPNVGWINFGNGPDDGVRYTNTSAGDFGVNNDGAGHLSGFAWGANIGWIAFDTSAAGGAQATISLINGRFQGYAYSANCGWISFEDVDAAVVARADRFGAFSAVAMNRLLDYLLGRAALTETQRAIADFNGDGDVDMADFVYLQGL